MSLKERLQEDWKTAMKARDSFRSSVLAMTRAAVLQVEKKDNSKLSDEAIIDVISKEVKQRKDSIVEFEKGNRQDLIDQANAEIKILLEYLPQQLTHEEIAKIVESAVEKVGATTASDMGKVMTVVMPLVKGRSDGKVVNQIVREYLK